MRPSFLLSLFAFTSTVISTPIALTPRQDSHVQIIVQEVNSVLAAVNGDLNATLTAVANSAKDVTAQIQLIATIQANFADIASQLENAGAEINASTIALAASLTAPEIEALASALQTVQTLVGNVNSAIQTTEAELTSDTFAAVKASYAAAIEAVKVLTSPLVTYLQDVTEVAEVGVDTILGALFDAVSSLISAIATLSAAI